MRETNIITLCGAIVIAIATLKLPLSPSMAVNTTNRSVIHVAPIGQDEPSCGTPQLPCRTLQYAVGIVDSGGFIKVAQGMYTAPGDAPAVLDITFGPGSQGKNLTIVGGYLPTNWDIPSSNPLLTILDGSGVHRVINIVSVPEIRVRIQGVTIQNGLANMPLSFPGREFSGGGIYCRNDHPYDPSKFVNLELANVVVKNNRVQGSGPGAASGGGVSLYYRCRALLEYVVFEDNVVIGGDAIDETRGAHALGGGLFATMKSDVEARGLILRRNKVQAGSGGRGYGSHEWDRADGLGGGAAFQYNSADLRNVIIKDNIAVAGGGSGYGGFGSGGGLFFEFSSGMITGGVLKGNRVYGGGGISTSRGGESTGGGLMATDSLLTLSELVVVNNRAIGGDGSYAGHAGGGGLYFTKAALSNVMRVSGTNLVLASNSAEAGSGQNRWGGGGAIFAQDADVSINHATIVSNSVLSTMVAPAVIALHNFEKSRVHLKNSIVAFHPNSAYPRAAVVSQKTGDEVILEDVVFWQNAGGNAGVWFEGASLTITNSLTGDPRLSSDFRLQKGSGAIDRASSSFVYTDIDNEPRPFRDGPDIGADEYVPIYLNVTPRDGALFLRWKTNPELVKGIGNYQICIYEEGSSICNVREVGASESSYLLSDLVNYRRYILRVDALDANGRLIESSNTVESFPTNRFIYLPIVVRGAR